MRRSSQMPLAYTIPSIIHYMGIGHTKLLHKLLVLVQLFEVLNAHVLHAKLVGLITVSNVSENADLERKAASAKCWCVRGQGERLGQDLLAELSKGACLTFMLGRGV